jgi:myo-inositol 2-dehydrogenase / D-chiro-inositol 1-dehydrogenase
MEINRRDFIKGTAAFSAVTVLKPEMVFGTNASSAVRMGIIGTGGRGLAVIGSMSANAGVQITAAADLYEDRLSAGVKRINELNRQRGFSDVAPSHQFLGPHAYIRLLESKDVDAVLISTPAYAHPDFLEAAVMAGKHVYSEKPAGIDAAGCRKILDVSESLDGSLSATIGFQIRYATPYAEMVKRIQRGDIGDIISAQLYYFSSGVDINPTEGMSYDEARIRNHYHFNEVSGGILLDQGIHMIDVCNWALQKNPVSAYASGGSKGSPEFGNTWTNYQVIFKYPGDINVTMHSTQAGPAFGDVCARFAGTEGIAEAHYSGGVFITGKNEWDSGIIRSAESLTPEQIAAGLSLSSLHDADRNKCKAFIESIENGEYINELPAGCNSTLSAVLGREAAIRREIVTWDEINLSPAKIDPRLFY